MEDLFNKEIIGLCSILFILGLIIGIFIGMSV